jgi:hypothetical protein
VASADVDIANSALAKLGAPLIVALTDNVRAAVICNEQYAKMRRKLLSSHPWNFATRRIALAATANTPVYDYSAEFLLASDVLRVLETDLPEDEPWEVEFNVDNNKVLLCNYSAVNIKYIKDITDPSKFPPYFEEALAWLLASDIAYTITQSSTLAQYAYTAYKKEVAEARSMDAQEAGRQSFETNPWIDVRY